MLETLDHFVRDDRWGQDSDVGEEQRDELRRGGIVGGVLHQDTRLGLCARPAAAAAWGPLYAAPTCRCERGANDCPYSGVEMRRRGEDVVWRGDVKRTPMRLGDVCHRERADLAEDASIPKHGMCAPEDELYLPHAMGNRTWFYHANRYTTCRELVRGTVAVPVRSALRDEQREVHEVGEA